MCVIIHPHISHLKNNYIFIVHCNFFFLLELPKKLDFNFLNFMSLLYYIYIFLILTSKRIYGLKLTSFTIVFSWNIIRNYSNENELKIGF